MASKLGIDGMTKSEKDEKPLMQEGVSLERQTYTIEEAAKIFGICRAVAYRKGVLPTIRIGNRRLVPKRAIQRLLVETA